MNESSFEGVGGLKIFTRSWQAEGSPRAVLVIVHGFNSHSGQYLWATEQFTKNGLAVYALDLRGRGRSEGERFYVETIDDFVTDIETFVQQAKSENPDLPVYMLGHSAGGVTSCVYALDHQAEIDGLICESFAYELPVPDIALSFLKGLSYITPHTHVFSLNNKDFSRDPEVVQSMNDDILIKGESQPAQTAAAMLRADDRLKKEFPLITIPVLIMHGTEDHATKPSGSQHFYEQAGSTDKTLKLYEGHFPRSAQRHRQRSRDGGHPKLARRTHSRAKRSISRFGKLVINDDTSLKAELDLRSLQIEFRFLSRERRAATVIK